MKLQKTLGSYIKENIKRELPQKNLLCLHGWLSKSYKRGMDLYS